MQSIAGFLVKQRKWICLLFVIAVVAAAACMGLVTLNYDDTQYLPDNSNTKSGLSVMEQSFSSGATATAMLPDTDAAQTLALIEQIKGVEGVSDVIWLEDLLLPLVPQRTTSDGETLELLLQTLQALPRQAETTTYEAIASLNALSQSQQENLLPLLAQVSQTLGAQQSNLGSQLAMLNTAVPDAILENLQSQQAQSGALTEETQPLLAAFIDGVLSVNQQGTVLAAEQAMQWLLQAVQVLPQGEATTGYEVYAALQAAFSQQQLPVVLQLLSSFGVDLQAMAQADAQSLAAPLPAQTLEKISAAKQQTAALSQLGTQGMQLLSNLTNTALQLQTAGSAQTGADVVAVAVKLPQVLPVTQGVTYGQFLFALCGNFDQVQLPLIGALLQTAAPQMAGSLDLSQLTMPLGQTYADTLQQLDSQISDFYQQNSALLTICFTEGDYAASTNQAIGEIIGLSDQLYVSGNAATTYYTQQSQMNEIVRASVMVVLVALILLVVLSSSWFDPVLYIVAIVVAIVLNLGTNFLFGSVSYLTQSIVCVLQLALSMDYAVFLLNRYKKERQSGLEAGAAMKVAWKRSLAPISASSLTTIACFITIMFMRYKLGLDMGAVMSKGILFSLLTVFVLLPGLIVLCDKWIMRAEHKTLDLQCNRLGKVCYKGRWPLAILAVLIVVPCAYFASHNTFVYGISASQGSQSAGIESREKIEEVFGTQEQLAVLIPKDDTAELELAQNLQQISGVTSVNAWATLEAAGFSQQVPQNMKAQLVGSQGYDRIILRLDCEEEGSETQTLLHEIRSQIEQVYGDQSYYLLGNTAAAEDLEQSTTTDFSRISWLSVLVVALIVALTFRSLMIPVILVAVIEGAVWVNMSIPALLHSPVVFLGYLIISNVLLGSTIDYAILFTSNYQEARSELPIGPAIAQAQHHSIRPIITSGLIFTAGGLILGLTSTIPTVQLLGYAIMRGGLCAMIMTMVVLPAILAVLDRPIWKCTAKSRRP